jgi:hypothetical protein
VKFLLSDDQYAQTLRERAVFHIVPMYNPDGVELGYGRENANGLDLERQWDKDPMQPETAALKASFEALMASEAPIEIALNMHSASACKRYFVYHDASGTSYDYAIDEERFIEMVRSHWPEGIEPWHYNVTWKDNTPTHFPESFFWFNHGRDVLALTYEDMHCPENGNYDKTAEAILRGIGDYLKLTMSTDVPIEAAAAGASMFEYSFPNPSGNQTTIGYRIPSAAHVTMRVYNSMGRQIAVPVDAMREAGSHAVEWDNRSLPIGIYICQLKVGQRVESRLLVVER